VGSSYDEKEEGDTSMEGRGGRYVRGGDGGKSEGGLIRSKDEEGDKKESQ